MSTRDKIVELIGQVAKKKVRPSDDESLFESGLLDSFALPDLVSAIESEFGISIPDSDLQPRLFDSIARIEKYVDQRRAG